VLQQVSRLPETGLRFFFGLDSLHPTLLLWLRDAADLVEQGLPPERLVDGCVHGPPCVSVVL
jgi:hypothetical protein